MDEGISLRAIMIAASILTVLAVFSAVVIYYSKAKELADVTNVSMQIEGFYLADIENTLTSAENVTGVQVKNLINYYYSSYQVMINVENLDLLNSKSNFNKSNVNNCQNNPIGKTPFLEADYKNINFNINPNQKFILNMKVDVNTDTTVFTLTGK